VTGQITVSAASINLEAIGAIYYRRPGSFRLDAGLPAPIRRFAAAEARDGFLGVLASLPCKWMNHPARTAAAAYKPVQLRLAAELGLSPPATVITNNPEDARAFAARHGGRAVYKTLTGGVMTSKGHALGVTTQVVSRSAIDESVGGTAHLFQEYIPKRHEVRLTVVGGSMFAVEIHPQTDEGRIDWRRTPESLGYAVTDVPLAVRTAVLELMQRLGLLFAALDFIVLDSHEWRFLEINPGGQWLWLEEATGVPIADAIAAELLQG
jgi:glutathione synthase/RimK-type ligase-like ATP-grasp enzyme